MNTMMKVFALISSAVMLFACGGGEDATGTAEKAVVATGMKRILSVTTPAFTALGRPVGFAVQQGYEWLQDTGSAYGCSTGKVFHPGADLNKYGTSGNGDKGELLYAIADGEVVYADDSHWASLIIRFPFGGKDYYAIYGHSEINSGSSDIVAFEIEKRVTEPGYRAPTFETPYVGMHVSRGQIVGLLWNHNTENAHLHFEIRSSDHPSPANGTDFCGYYGGKSKAEIARFNRDPLGFVVSYGYIDGTCRILDPGWSSGGVFCWTSDPVGSYATCGQGAHHVQYVVSANRALWVWSGFNQDTVASYCSHLNQDAMDIKSYLGRAESFFGGDEGGWLGAGYIVGSTEDPYPDPPDFVTKRVSLHTPWGTEVYKFGLGESFDTKAQSANIGDGPCKSGEISTITGHFYLSKGYKEDVHSGSGAWRRTDSTTTECGSLKSGDTNTETKNTRISDFITAPGIYNIVYCIDHPLDDHNNGGDHKEKHESNNCSTEAVFEVTANRIENVPNVDLTVTSFVVLQTPVYAGDYIRLGAWIKNQGTVNATNDIRSSYTVSCNGGPTTILTDDGTGASQLTAGASTWEEILTPVLLPNVVGTCALTFTADYLGAQTETDKTNNSMSLTVTLLPRPAPNLVITKFEDKVGCCTTNTGAAPKPRIWVRNDGPVAPGGNVTVVYQVSSPVATGGLYQTIGYGSIEPRELAPDDTDEDQMDCDGCWRIPTNSAWKKQWHNFRACLRTDGGTPVLSTGSPSPGEICAVYQRYSKS